MKGSISGDPNHGGQSMQRDGQICRQERFRDRYCESSGFDSDLGADLLRRLRMLRKTEEENRTETRKTVPTGRPRTRREVNPGCRRAPGSEVDSGPAN